jgi:hypothetical protein
MAPCICSAPSVHSVAVSAFGIVLGVVGAAVWAHAEEEEDDDDDIEEVCLRPDLAGWRQWLWDGMP